MGFWAACVQMNSRPEIADNLGPLEEGIRAAAAAGARLIATPENSTLLVQGRERLLERATTEADHPALPLVAGLARETDTHILLGSIAAKLDDGRCANRSLLFAPSGEIIARYDKAHLFDVDLPNGERYRESATFAPGNRVVAVDTALGRIGLSICYDMRFAALYRRLAKAGADIICVPAAFTVPTGMAHWHVLLRARAIETGCHILAPAQVGSHDGNRSTYGHSLIVSPWGEVLADGGSAGPGVALAWIDPARTAEARSRIPQLQHDRSLEG